MKKILLKIFNFYNIGKFSILHGRVFVMNIPMTDSSFSHIKEASIVTYIAATVQGSTLYQVLEPLQCSLRSYLPRWHEEFESNKVNQVVGVMKSIVSGLRYLHDKRFVHFDTSMDTVAVCIDCILKLVLLACLHEVHRAIVVTSVVPVYVYVYVYVYVRVTLSVKVFKIVIS